MVKLPRRNSVRSVRWAARVDLGKVLARGRGKARVAFVHKVKVRARVKANAAPELVQVARGREDREARDGLRKMKTAHSGRRLSNRI